MPDKFSPPVSTKSPEPLDLHEASAKAQADNDRATRLIMAAKGLTWPEAQEEVKKAGGADKVLAAADKAAADSVALPERPKVGAPHAETTARLDALEKRVAALEASGAAKTLKVQ